MTDRSAFNLSSRRKKALPSRRQVVTGIGAVGLALASGRARADEKITIAYQYGLQYLPMMVMQEQKYVENNVKGKAVQVDFAVLTGPAQVTDALLSNSAQFGTVGPPGMAQLWARTINGLGFKTLGALSAMPYMLITRNPAVKTINDFTESDRIALPSIKSSLQAVCLQMACVKEYGPENFSKLDRLTVSMTHPDAMIALLSGQSQITAHFGSPPFQYQELDKPEMHKVLDNFSILGGPVSSSFFTTSTRYAEKNPEAFAAVAKALEQSTAWINAHRQEAAALYIAKTRTKESMESVMRQLNDPQFSFGINPQKLLPFVDFMHSVGTIKVKANSWKELAFANVHDQAGS
ncbi:ABC transporter substrate-binding protein [Afipia carboxidovorans]|uniref:ABC transporter substrate-binding protein n=1 Tax=Afipia carboxidovorans TaxID=40137 RepID=UPI0030937AFA|nr:ABC transporter substrate-binding protein [Afipia carboxidovorans]